MIRAPELLSKETGHQCETIGTLNPYSMSIDLRTEDLSSAQMTLAASEECPSLNDWIKLYYPNGKWQVYYINSINQDKKTGDNTLSLQHAFGLLKDAVSFGEKSPSDMGGTSTKVSLDNAAAFLLGRQSAKQAWWTWRGNPDMNPREGWTFTDTDVYSGLQTLLESAPGCRYTFDFSTFPWEVGLTNGGVGLSEMRMNRNIAGMRVSIDKTGMYNRIYPTGAKNIHISSVNNDLPYLEDYTSSSKWGLISAVYSDSSIEDKELLMRTAQKLLAQNSTPIITVVVNGFDLYDRTRETIDRIQLGATCVVPLPQYGETFEAIVTELSWQDAILQPDNVSVTLSNSRKRASHVIRQQQQSVKRSGKARDKQIKKLSTAGGVVDSLNTDSSSAGQVNLSAILNTLPHTHNVTVTADGKLQLGAVSATSDPFDMAATDYVQNLLAAKYTEGYEAGQAAGGGGTGATRAQVKSWTVTQSGTLKYYNVVLNLKNSAGDVVGTSSQLIRCSYFYYPSYFDTTATHNGVTGDSYNVHTSGPDKTISYVKSISTRVQEPGGAPEHDGESWTVKSTAPGQTIRIYKNPTTTHYYNAARACSGTPSGRAQ